MEGTTARKQIYTSALGHKTKPEDSQVIVTPNPCSQLTTMCHANEELLHINVHYYYAFQFND